MANYDLTHLPPPVQEALLRLTEALVDGWPAAAAAAVPAVRSPSQTRQPTPTLAPTRCTHGTPATPGCAAWAVVDAAETVLVNVQTPPGQAFPRSALELRVLEVLQTMYPLALNAVQLAQILGIPRGTVRQTLVALGMLKTIDRPSYGHYRHKPLSEEGRR